MIRITLPDGSVKEYEKGVSVSTVAGDISRRLQQAAVAGKVNGDLVDLDYKLEADSAFEVVTLDTEEGLSVLRHSTAHVMAQAVKRLFPEAKLAIGPVIENGFYYDFDLEQAFTPEVLEKIETEMNKIIESDYAFSRKEVSKEEAREFFAARGEKYKVELIEDLDGNPSLYQQAEFLDLCRGPHLPSTGKIKAFKLLSVAGAYWRGDSKREMLQRIYGTAFAKKKDLDEHLFRLEEAAKRDHRKIGRELDLFSIQEEGPGFPFFHPKGMVLWRALEDFWREEHRKAGYVEIKTPIILSESLWRQSGHWDHYKENMYFTTIDEQGYAIKPMNCPGSMLLYRRKIHSYRDFPLRVAELGLVHRHELSGTLHGLMRVRCFTQDDAHIFMLPSQIKDEIVGVINLIDHFYRDVFGFQYHVELSTRPPDSMGSDEIWEMATNALREALEAKGMEYKVNEGDGAFYGPKIDFHLEDSMGRTWQCGTIQLDFLMPERFDLTYVGEDGQQHRPVMIHRVVFGAMERMIAILTEHFAGAFPVWLSPVQVKVIPIGEGHLEYARKVEGVLTAAGVRVEVDKRDEKLGYKIRTAQMEKIPYMLVVGDKEAQEETVAVRERKEGDMGAMPLGEFRDLVVEKIEAKQ